MNNTWVEYEQLADEVLAAIAQTGDFRAEEILMRRYKDAVRIKAKAYFMVGAAEDDIIQEGMIGLLKATRHFDADREASFATYASLCVTRQILSAIKMASRKKHAALNTSVSLNNPVEGEEGVTLEDTLKADMADNPEARLVAKDMVEYLLYSDRIKFSNLEKQVIELFREGLDYVAIAEKMGRSPKSIDNAMQRIRKKISKDLENEF